MDKYLLWLLAAFLVLCKVKCRSLNSYIELQRPGENEIAFMRKYGYLPEDSGPDGEATFTPYSIAAAVRRVQAFAGLPRTGLLDEATRKATFTPYSLAVRRVPGLPRTGLLDEATRKLFTKRRCGVRDIGITKARIRRYILVQGWNKSTITYRVLNGSSTFDKARVQARMAAALALWAPHGSLDFVMVDDGPADIQVSFVAQEHEDGFPFDGPGRVVAHAFPPPHGAMHFDDEETWGDNPDGEDDEVTDFFAVAVHEIGHALGLSHSNVKDSVMYPYYQVPVERLGMDDVLGMQELYLKYQTEEPSNTESPVLSRTSLDPHFTIATASDERPDLCYAYFDTLQVIQGRLWVFEEEVILGRLWVFEEEWVWVMSQRKQVDAGFPRLFHEIFVGLPAHVTVVRAIYEKANANIVIFSGRDYWEFSPTFKLQKHGTVADYSLPRSVQDVSTAFLSNYNNKTYLFEYEHERFWRFDESSWMLDRGYPKNMNAWRGIPGSINAAIIWQGDTYFFSEARFWRFDNTLVEAHSNYPLPTAPIWFPCQESPAMERFTVNEYR